MNIIKFNKSVEVEVESYGKNTYFNGANMTSNANCTVKTDNIAALNELATSPITNIQIYSDGIMIYELDEINAKIDNISEYLNGNRIDVNISLSFIFDNE